MPPDAISGWHAPPQRGRCPGIRVRFSDLQNRRKRQCFRGQHSSEGASVFSHGWSGDRIAVGAQPVVSFSSGLALKGRHNSRTVSPSKGRVRPSSGPPWIRTQRGPRSRDFSCMPLRASKAPRDLGRRHAPRCWLSVACKCDHRDPRVETLGHPPSPVMLAQRDRLPDGRGSERFAPTERRIVATGEAQTTKRSKRNPWLQGAGFHSATMGRRRRRPIPPPPRIELEPRRDI